MKLKLTKNYDGNVEVIYGDITVMLTDAKPFIVLTEKEYDSIPEYKQYLFTNGFVLVEFIEEEIVEVIKEMKKK